MLADTCKQLEFSLPIRNGQIFEEFNLLSGHPWEEVAQSPVTNYYSCLFGIVQQERPTKVLEIGTAFGLSGATLLKACQNIELFISMDLGIYGEQLGFSKNNIEFARTRIHHWGSLKNKPLDCIRFYRCNTQPAGKGDNENGGAEIHRWYQIPDLVRLLGLHDFDVIFVDGKHTQDGLLNDLEMCWRFLRPGGLIVCDDLHDEPTYKGVFPWAGDTLRSFEVFLNTYQWEIEDSYIWNFPRVPPEGIFGLRPFGLIRKKLPSPPLSGSRGFEMFDSPDAMEINRARQDHLASLGLEWPDQTVLEVGAGVGWHTTFFEKFGCSVMSTDARVQNVEEHLRRYPRRKVEVADLAVPGSHDRFGRFDIVYCYGTLYHLSDPALCLKELSKNCQELFLLETCVSPEDHGTVNLVEENPDNPNQSFEGSGCRPSRNWIMSKLREHYPYVYTTIYQPNHVEFPTTWPATLPPGIQNARAVFVASRHPYNLPSLSSSLLNNQPWLEPILFSRSEDIEEDIEIVSEKVRAVKDEIPVSEGKDHRRPKNVMGDLLRRYKRFFKKKDKVWDVFRSDIYWKKTARFLRRHISEHDNLIAPAEFKNKFPQSKPYVSWPMEEPDVQWVVVHKGMMDEIEYNLLTWMTEKIRPVFANEVFVIFSSYDHLREVDRNSVHYKAFDEKMKEVISREPSNTIVNDSTK